MKDFFTDEKVAELISCIREAGSRRGGMKKFAGKHGLSWHSVKNYFYEHILTPELDRILPRVDTEPPSAVKRFFDTQEKVEELLACIERTGSKRKGFIEFAKKHNLNPNGVQNYYYQNILPQKTSQEDSLRRNSSQEETFTQKPTPNIQTELYKVMAEKGFPSAPLSKEDIDAVAEKTGAHYHTVLSTLGSITARGEFWAKITSDPEWRYYTSRYSAVHAEARINDKKVILVAEEEGAKRQLEKVKPGCEVIVTGEFTNIGPEVQFKVRSISGLEESLEKLAEEQAREQEEREAACRAAVEGMFGEPLRLPSDIDRLLERVSRQKGINKKKLEDAYMELMDSPVYSVWRAMLREKELEAKRYELRAESVERENGILKQELEKMRSANFVVISREQAELLPTCGYLLGLYQKIAEQEEKIRALRRLSMVYLEALQKKNAELQRFREQTVSRALSSENAAQGWGVHVH
ncbi:hypothetical protein SAMN02745218_01136 [Desulfofundulus australicus DSM 11792]|uniref:Uncharacterized protein n=1 Tax=Desulfofundulus australicus DSM 11792 TaxID=1121425 RepID=A0A1M4XQT2_9FIRM|nr:hypothetical protein [Desulfofundulus australicus]SHE95927.1 hypothetical protein SAMN02745218_01136 [Desulfofundulus australicus DSM 11792]